MFKLIEKIQAKPSDRNIRIIRIVFALILLGVIYFGFQNTKWEFSQIPSAALYSLYIFPLIGLIRGIFDPGIMRKKLWKWTQVTLGVLLLLLSWFLIETDMDSHPAAPVVTVSGELDVSSIVNQTGSTPSGGIDTDFWIGFLGFWLALGGLILSSKNITKKNERYGEKVTKIRV